MLNYQMLTILQGILAVLPNMSPSKKTHTMKNIGIEPTKNG